VPAWWVFVVLAVLAAGCESVRGDLMPLAVGNLWRYRVTSAGRDLGEESVRVTGRRASLVAGGGGVGGAGRFEVAEPGGLTTWTKTDGIVMRHRPGGSETVLQPPPFIGFGWTEAGRGGRPVFSKVLARETVETPGGVFADCIVVRRETEDRSLVVTRWFARGVGIVKRRVVRAGRSTLVRELLEHRIESAESGSRPPE
jgi:hypothetical protein